MMTVLIVDGQGGRLGKQLVKEVRERFPQLPLMAVGTNSMATEAIPTIDQYAFVSLSLPLASCLTI